MEAAKKSSASLEEILGQGVKRFLEECTSCGLCLENCPIFLEPKFELAGEGSQAVVGKVIDLLQGGPTSAEAYKMSYGCLQGCTNRCKPACPLELEMQQALMAAGHRLRAAGEGFPPRFQNELPRLFETLCPHRGSCAR